MIQKISIKQYRKLREMDFDFQKGINILSGTNGTCKTSLLYIISNSFQAVNKKCSWLNEKGCLDIINGINNIMNPKIESLTRGDKTYNDPAKGCNGTLYTCSYFDGKNLGFRRHNSTLLNGKSRFSVKPLYRHGSKDSLPQIPVIYLGLARLYPYGEYQNDDAIKLINKKLPDSYLQCISDIYKSFTGIQIKYDAQEKMGDIKTRAEFSSELDGIDSNTISAGEDNLSIIITALVSLKYYFESISSEREVESVLLIDEIDATLHPAFQIKLLEKLDEFSTKYKIQIFFTTHSLTLLEDALNKKYNVVYLIDNIDSVIKMEDVDIYKIKMNLKSKLKQDIYLNRTIPIFTEDAEARIFLNCIFDYYERKYREKFIGIRGLFHLVDANISCDNLVNIFEDSALLRSTMRSICILDGDQNAKQNLSNYIIILPGGKSPEDLVFDYVDELFNNNDPFWVDETILSLGYTKIYYRDNIKVKIDGIKQKLESLRSNGQSTKGVKREENKKLFKEFGKFFELVLKNWINAPQNENEMDNFYINLKIMFKKVSEFHDINSNEWKD